MATRRSPARDRRRPRPNRAGRKAPTRDVIVALNKPYGVLSQFTPDGSKHRPLKELGLPDDVWPVGRLDADSEGLLLLASSPDVNARLLSPERGHPRTYWVQVERIPDDDALERLRTGVDIKGHHTRPADVERIDDPGLAERDPPVRFRKSVPTCWLSMTLTEGKNRQVRKMTAAVGHPTLRLFRARIGTFMLSDLAPGAWRELTDDEVRAVFSDDDKKERA